MSEFLLSMVIVVINTFTIVNVILIMKLFFGLEDVGLKKMCITAASFLVLDTVLCMICGKDSDIEFIAILLFLFLAPVVLSKTHKLQKLYYVIPAYFMYNLWNNLLKLFDRIFGLERYSLVIDKYEYTPLYFLSDAILFVFLLYLIYKIQKDGAHIRIKFLESVFILVFCCFEPAIELALKNLEDTFQFYAYSVAWAVIMLVINVVIFYGLFYRNNAQYYRRLSENYKQQFDDEYTYFKDYKKEQKEIVKFRHDMKNHMMVIQSMLDKEDYTKAKEYFDNLTGANVDYKYNRFLTGNEIVDIILNIKSDKMSEEDIKFQCNGGLDSLSFMEDVDICTLFSNLIDNAIEANEKCKKDRFISIQTKHNDDFTMIVVSNRTGGKAEIKEGKLITSKRGANHGIGTQNIFEIIKKYNGKYEIFTNDNVFSIQIIL